MINEERQNMEKSFHFPEIVFKCETAKETQMYRADFWTLRERERVG